MNFEKTDKLNSVCQYFSGSNFNRALFITTKINSFKNIFSDDINSSSEDKKVESVRMVTNFTPKKSGTYTFKSNEDDFINIFINGESVLGKDIFLDNTKDYKFVIAYFGNNNVTKDTLSNLNIYQLINGKEEMFDINSLSMPNKISFEELIEVNNYSNEQNLLDTDDDGIFDNWEMNGYTVINGVVVEWNESYKNQGYKKFVSNPYDSHTAGDPYSDLEKVTGALDKSINLSAWNPLVAVYPSISVGMERLVISKNKDITTGKDNTKTQSVGSSIGNTNTAGVDASASYSLFGPSVSISGSYSHASTQTVDSTQTSGQSWNSSIGINSGESAFLNANIRYYNTGTAPIYDLKPTTNLVLGKDTLATITGQENQVAFNLPPHGVYPKMNLHGIALNTMDTFSSKPITINYEQLSRLEKGELLKLETTQFNGSFMQRSPNGGQVVISKNEWAHYIPQIENVTAGIIINLNNNRIIERRVAAKNPKNPNDMTPELTLLEAIKTSFNTTTSSDNILYLISEITGRKYPLDISMVQFIVDKNTKKLIEEEFKKLNHNNTLYDIKIRPKMNIQINVPRIFDTFESNEKMLKWEGSYEILNSQGVNNSKCMYSTNNIKIRNLNLLNKVDYCINMNIKSESKGTLTLLVNDSVSGTKQITSTYGKISFRYTALVNEHGINTIELEAIKSGSSQKNPIYIDNFSITLVGSRQDVLKEKNLQYAEIVQGKANKRHNGYECSFSPIYHNNKFLINFNGMATIKPFGTANHMFNLKYDEYTGGFRICKNLEEDVLTWNPTNQRLVFKNYIVSNYQLWILDEYIIDGFKNYRLISLADRSKCIEFCNTDSLLNLIINDIDEKNTGQLFSWD